MSLIDAKLYGTLDAQNFKKIFPQQYYRKFAAHLKVLEFEKNLFATPPQSGKLKFTKRQHKNTTHRQQFIQPKTLISGFARIADTIQNDKEQIIRFKAINKTVAEKIRNSDSKTKVQRITKTNEIKMISNQEEVNDKIINDMLIESTRETNDKIKVKLQSMKNDYFFCKFTKREQSGQGKNSYKSKLSLNLTKKYNSQKKISLIKINQNPQVNLSKKLPQSKLKAENHASVKNISLIDQKQHPSLLKENIDLDQLQMRTQSKSLKSLNGLMNVPTRIKSSQKLMKKPIYIDKDPIKIDWIKETNKLKSSKHQIKNCVYSEEINHPWKKTIADILSENLNPESKISLK